MPSSSAILLDRWAGCVAVGTGSTIPWIVSAVSASGFDQPRKAWTGWRPENRKRAVSRGTLILGVE